jgi:putative ABC transport system ATP-binding protein
MNPETNLKNSSNAFIQLEHIRKVFKTAAGESLVLKDINVSIRQGEFVSVVGRSGSGKSTLTNMITGIDHPTTGTIRVGDTLLNGMQESPMSVWRGKNLGIVFQFFQLLPMLTLVENVMLPMDFCGCYPPDEREARAMGLLDRVGLREYAHQLPGAISGGQQQTTAVARALANDPPILIADEPTGNLDSRTAETVMALFEELSSQGKTILMVTHDNALANRTGRKLIISDGELIHEAISQAFPDLDHHSLLELNHLGKEHTYSPGQSLSDLTGEPITFLVASGSLRTKGHDALNGVFHPGDFLSGVFPSNHQFAAGPEGMLQILTFPRQQFQRLTGRTDSQPASEAVPRPSQNKWYQFWKRGK